MRARLPLLAVFVGALLLVASCASVLDARASAALREALIRVVGPAATYDVTVSGASLDGTRFDRVHLVGTRIARPQAPVLDRLDLELTGVVVDRAEKKLSAVATSRAELQLRGADLADYLRRWLADPVVTLSAPDRIDLVGAPRLGGIELGAGLDAEIGGRLVAAGTLLRLSIDRVRLGRNDAPGFVRGVLDRLVNPVVDVAAYPLPARIDAVEIEGDAIRLRGSGSRLRSETVSP